MKAVDGVSAYAPHHCRGSGRTSLADDATHPWAVMVHLLHAAVDLTAVGGPVLLPVIAGAAPTWSAIGVADEDGFAVEAFEPRAVDIWVWPVCVV